MIVVIQISFAKWWINHLLLPSDSLAKNFFYEKKILNGFQYSTILTVDL